MVALNGWVASDGYPTPIQQLTLKDLVQNRRHKMKLSYNWINKDGADTEPIPVKPTCMDGTLAHHWIIERTGKSKSLGTCTRCGKSYEFSNTATVKTGRKEYNENGK